MWGSIKRNLCWLFFSKSLELIHSSNVSKIIAEVYSKKESCFPLKSDHCMYFCSILPKVGCLQLSRLTSLIDQDGENRVTYASTPFEGWPPLCCRANRSTGKDPGEKVFLHFLHINPLLPARDYGGSTGRQNLVITLKNLWNWWSLLLLWFISASLLRLCPLSQMLTVLYLEVRPLQVIRSQGWGPHKWDEYTDKESQRFPSPVHPMRTQQRQPSMNQEEGPHQRLNLSVPWSLTSASGTVNNKFLLLTSYPVCGISL